MKRMLIAPVIVAVAAGSLASGSAMASTKKHCKKGYKLEHNKCVKVKAKKKTPPAPPQTPLY
jgi:hypothetical protein